VRHVRIVTGDGRAVCERCGVADTPLLRLRGLLGRAALEPGEGLLLRPTGSVHMFGMRFAVDAVFCDRELRVVGVTANLRPWRAAGRLRAKATLELAAGEAERRGVAPGVQLRIADA
jgi:uncharacterized protein